MFRDEYSWVWRLNRKSLFASTSQPARSSSCHLTLIYLAYKIGFQGKQSRNNLRMEPKMSKEGETR